MILKIPSFVGLVSPFISLVAAQAGPIPLVCHTGVQILAVPGANVPNGTYGRTITFVNDTLGNISDSSSYSVSYNRFHLLNQSASVFIPEVNQGVPAFHKALSNYTAACPNTPIVLHGYSEGAVIVANLLCGASSRGFKVSKPLSSWFAPKIIAVILYGDESRTAGLPYDYGTCNASGPNLIRSNPAGCNAFAPTFQSYCNDNDIACCATANASAPWPGGINPHWLYPNYYDGNATRFVVAQYASFIAAHPPKTTTLKTVTTSSTTTTAATTTAATTTVTPA